MNAEQMFAWGMAAIQAEDFVAADRCFRELVAAYPQSHEAWNALAWANLRGAQPDIALEYALRAHELSRKDPDYLNTLAVAYGEMGQFAAAEAALRKALKLKPTFLDGLLNLGKVLQKQQRVGESLKALERAYAIDPLFPNLAVTLSGMHRRLGDAQRARVVLNNSARAIDPQDLAIAVAECDFELHGEERAIDGLRRALAQSPDWQVARYSLSHLLLSTGQWREGWAQYYWRTHLGSGRAGKAQEPLPAHLAGKRILLRGEQGLGDVLFFLRFAPLLRERGALITLACQKKLLRLLVPGAGLHDVREASQEDAADPAFDYRLWIGDLPGLLDCDATPPAWPFSLSEGAKSAGRQRLAALGPAPYLAVTWRAGTDVVRGREFGGDRTALMKVVPPALLGACLRGWPGTILLLQREAPAEERAAFQAAVQAPAHDLSDLGDDLPSLMGVLGVVDDYVTVSNTNVHLLAGLGRVARVLVPYPGEWRWMRRGGPSPWFPGFPVYRQPQSRDWGEPLGRLRADLFP